MDEPCRHDRQEAIRAAGTTAWLCLQCDTIVEWLPSVADMAGTFTGPDSVEWLRQQRLDTPPEPVTPYPCSTSAPTQR